MSILSVDVREYHRDGFHLARGSFNPEEIGPFLRSAKEDSTGGFG